MTSNNSGYAELPVEVVIDRNEQLSYADISGVTVCVIPSHYRWDFRWDSLVHVGDVDGHSL